MISDQRDDDFTPPSLDPTSAHEWRVLSSQAQRARSQPNCASVSSTLTTAIEREPQSPSAPAYRLWIGDNFARDGNYPAAIDAYDRALDCGQEPASPLVDGIDFKGAALRHKAQNASFAGETDLAIATYRLLAAHTADDANPLFQAGLLAERAGEYDLATALYRERAARTASPSADDPAQLARRALERLDTPPELFARDPRDVADRLTAALERRDFGTLRNMISTTHFSVGLVAGHFLFENLELLEDFYHDLARSHITVRSALLGEGEKRYLHTSGWAGNHFKGDVLLMIMRSPAGWRWTGFAVTQLTDFWTDRWFTPAAPPGILALTEDELLPFELLAPWPADQCFMAGGFSKYVAEQIAIAAAWPLGGILALYLSTGDCGFGPRGYYYDSLISHNGTEKFAIDFSRYRQYVPYDSIAGGTRVLAARGGVVKLLDGGVANGDSSRPNFVNVEHDGPGGPADVGRYTTRYLHLEGPNRLHVLLGAHVRTGQVLGTMDDTGKSVINHLHFSIHDKQIPLAGSGGLGASIRPSPLGGVTLGDGDSGKCVCSNNIPYDGGEMIEITEFAGQNWLITPAATAAGQAPPQRHEDQLYLMILSGVGMLGLKGVSGSNWRRDTVAMRPELDPPLQFAIGKYGIPVPAGGPAVNFQVEQWAPFASLGSIYNAGESVNSGFAVDLWRPNPFGSGTNAIGGAPVDNLFTGIQVDVAVRDSDAYLYRLGYNIALIGRIVFTQVIIT